MKQTKNKYLRQLVRNYEIELQRPKGLKLLDLVYNQVPDSLKNKFAFFVSENVHKELKGMTRYKGCTIYCGNGMNKSTVIASNPENMWYNGKQIDLE